MGSYLSLTTYNNFFGYIASYANDECAPFHTVTFTFALSGKDICMSAVFILHDDR